MKHGGHPPNLPVGFWIGLVMCALDKKSHENSSPPAALHFRPALGCQEARRKVTGKIDTKIALQQRIFTDPPSVVLLNPAWCSLVHEKGSLAQAGKIAICAANTPGPALSPALHWHRNRAHSP